MSMRDRLAILLAIVLGAICSERVGFANDFSYQSLTNLGPCASSRVLLMNNDTNETCPIQGQGYHDTSNTVAVGQTYWWHDDTPCDFAIGAFLSTDLMNLQIGSRHILYYKQPEGCAPVKLWELVNCRAGSPAMKISNGFNFLPWSSTCQPIDEGTYSAPILNEWTQGQNSNGVRQVAVITMRASRDATIYSPFYEDGIGEIYFDAVNFGRLYNSCHIGVEVSTELIAQSLTEGSEAYVFDESVDVSRFQWRRVACEVFKVFKVIRVLKVLGGIINIVRPFNREPVAISVEGIHQGQGTDFREVELFLWV